MPGRFLDSPRLSSIGNMETQEALERQDKSTEPWESFIKHCSRWISKDKDKDKRRLVLQWWGVWERN